MTAQIVDSGKKGQVKMQQMAFLLIVLTLFFVLAGLFVLSISFSGLKDKKAVLDEKNAIELVSRLANYPEISCERAFDIQKSSCIDFDKVMAFSRMNKDYSKFWRVKQLEIRKIYPESDREIICTEENYPNCNYLKVLSNDNITGYDKSKYVILCRKASTVSGAPYNKCELSELIVRFDGE